MNTKQLAVVFLAGITLPISTIAQVSPEIKYRDYIDKNNPYYSIAIEDEKSNTYGLLPTEIQKRENLETVLIGFFKSTNCFTQEVRKKMKDKLRRNGVTNAIPRDLSSALSNQYDKLLDPAPPLFAMQFLHTFEYVDSNNQYGGKLASLPSAASFQYTSPFNLLKEGGSLFYMQDCSGYLNTLVSADIGFSLGDVESAAEANIESSSVSTVTMGNFSNLVFAALDDSQMSYSARNYIGSYEHLSTLYALLKTLKTLNDPSKIRVSDSHNMIATSRINNSSTQGMVSGNGSIGLNIGVIGVNAESNGGINVSRQFDMKSPDIYLIPPTETTITKEFSKEDIMARASFYYKTLMPSHEGERSSQKISFDFILANNLCTPSNWEFRHQWIENNQDVTKKYTAKTTFDDAQKTCRIEFPLDSTIKEKLEENLSPTLFLEPTDGITTFIEDAQPIRLNIPEI